MKNKLRAFGRSLLLDVGLRGKLLCIFFLLLVLPLGAFTLYGFHRINTVIEEQTYSAAQKAFEDTHTAVEDLLGRLTQVADILAMDPSLYALAASDPAGTSYIQRLEDRDRISTTFTYLRSMSGVDRVRLYVSNDYLYTNSADIVSLDSVRNSAWFSAFESGSAVGWFGPADFADQPEGERDWYSLMRLIYDPSHVQHPLAILRVDVAACRFCRSSFSWCCRIHWRCCSTKYSICPFVARRGARTTSPQAGAPAPGSSACCGSFGKGSFPYCCPPPYQRQHFARWQPCFFTIIAQKQRFVNDFT